MPPLVEMKDVYKIYHMGDTEVHALDGISLTINKGEFVAIVGQSGSGKSTCMNIIGCLDVATKGVYRLNGREINNYSQDELSDVRNKMLGFIFQQYNLLPKLTVLENVELPLLYAGLSDAEQEKRALASLDRVGLKSKAKNHPTQLSGGQQQRVSIARALALDPEILFFDEPTSALDPELTAEVLRVIKDLAAQNMTMVIVTHAMQFARDVADRVVFMDKGVVLEDAAPAELFGNPKHQRTREFLSRYLNDK